MKFKKISVELEVTLYRQLKHKAIDKSSTMSDLIRKAISEIYGDEDGQNKN